MSPGPFALNDFYLLRSRRETMARLLFPGGKEFRRYPDMGEGEMRAFVLALRWASLVRIIGFADAKWYINPAHLINDAELYQNICSEYPLKKSILYGIF